MANDKTSNGNKKGARNATDELFETFSPNNMLNNAQRIMSTAANVLEEEIAAGILAAKRIEKKVIDTDDLYSDPNELMSRIRRDTHDAVDIFLDAMTALTQQLGILTNNLKKEQENTSSAKQPAKTASSSPFVNVASSEMPVKAGDLTSLHISLSNDQETSVEIVLAKADLIGPGAQKILARNITIEPASLLLNPKEEKEVAISIKVPASAKPGHYCALFTDEKDPFTRTVIAIDVI